jgi:hypothetical protein
VQVREGNQLRVALAACGNARLKHDPAAHDLHDRERVHIPMRINTDHVVQLICKHPYDLQPRLVDNSGAGLEVKTAGDKTVTDHAPTGRTGF